MQFQQFLNLNVHKILHPSQTRWLSLSSVEQRIVEQWDALKLYFSDKWLSEKLISAKNIYLQKDRLILLLRLIFTFRVGSSKIHFFE